MELSGYIQLSLSAHSKGKGYMYVFGPADASGIVSFREGEIENGGIYPWLTD